MSASKHTPGPWVTEAIEEATGLPATYITSGGGWANSGTVGRRTVAVVGHWTDRPNPDADARLIALAPEMLEALEELLAQAEACTYIGSDGHRYGSYIETATLPEMDAAIASARALIRRARGEEVTR